MSDFDGTIDKAQSVINVLSALDTDYGEIMTIGHMLLALAAERLEVSNEAVVDATRANVPSLRALWQGATRVPPEDAEKIRKAIASRKPSRIILP